MGTRRSTLYPQQRRSKESLGWNFKRAFPKHSFNSPAASYEEATIKRINIGICAEMKELLKRKYSNSVRCFTCMRFSHGMPRDSHYATLQRIAPFLVGILDGCIPKSSSRRQCTIATCIAVLVKSHRRSTLLHLLVSLVLSSGHAAKQVCISSIIALLMLISHFIKGVLKVANSWYLPIPHQHC